MFIFANLNLKIIRMKHIRYLWIFCAILGMDVFLPLRAQTVDAWIGETSTTYAVSSLPSLAACDSITVRGTWKDADLLKLRAVVPIDGTARLQTVDMSGMSFSGDIERGMYSIFYNCPLLKEVRLPSTVQTAKINMRRAFADNPNLIGVVNLENLQNITSIDTLFRNCVKLQSVAFSSSVQNANVVSSTRAFNRCEALTDVDLSHFAALSDGNNLFDSCVNLVQVRFADVVNGQKNSFGERFKNCSKLQTIENLDKFTNITAISSAFYNCASLESVAWCDVPQTMSGSGKEAFRGCSRLTSVANLGIFAKLSNFEMMFRDCKSLESVDLPANTTAKNAKQMFYRCDNLRRADLSSLTGLTDFESTFNGCALLQEVTLASATSSVDAKFNSSFAGCKALLKVLNFDKYIAISNLNNTFKQCAVLDSVRFGCDPSAAAASSMTFDECKATCLKFMPCGTSKAASWQDKGTDKTASYNDSTFVYDIRTSDFDEQTQCDSYQWHGTTYTNSGDYLFTLKNGAKNGCDSIDRLRLTICQSYRFDDTQNVCDSLLWQGEWRKSSGIYIKKYTTVQGCDSIYTLALTVRQSTARTDTHTACDTFEWIDGRTYTESNNAATCRLTNAAGCDSVVTLDLTLNYTQHGDTTATECASFVWRGTTYTRSGFYIDTIPHGAVCGCDSIVTLNLTILPVAMGDTTVLADSNPYRWHGNTYTVAGNYCDTLRGFAANGCDSIVTLHLSFCRPYAFHSDTVACDSLWWQGRWITASGDYIRKYTTQAGCDSIYTLKLLIVPTPQATLSDLETYCDRTSPLAVAYEVLAGTPDRYSLFFETLAVQAGFQNVESAFLPHNVVTIDVPHDVPMGSYAATIVFADSRSTDGCAAVSLPIEIEIGFDAAYYLVQKWNDVIVVRNSGDGNPPIRFVAYQWYKNDQKIAGATLQHLYEADGLDSNAVYSVELTTDDGRTFRSCGFVPQLQQQTRSDVVVCPNPVMAGAMFELLLPPDVAAVSVYSAQGVCVYRLDRPAELVPISNHFVPGVYIVCVVMGDGRTETTKLTVE